MSRHPSLASTVVAAVLAAPALFLASPGRALGQSPFTSSQPSASNPFGTRGALMPANPSSSSSADPRAEAVMPGVGPGAAVGGAEPMNVENVGPDYKLRRGDVLSYQVREDRDPQTTVQVSDSGEFLPPYLGRGISAAGKTVGQLQGEVRSALERDLYVHATVQMGLMRVAPRGSRGRVYMTGQIRNIGPLELPTDESLTVSKAVLRAGGFKDFANQRKVKLLRKDGASRGITVDVKAVLDGKNVEDPVLQPGDTVQVTEKTFNISF